MDKIVLPSRSREADDALSIASEHVLIQPASSAGPVITRTKVEPEADQAIETPQDVLSILKAKPSLEQLRECLDLLCDESGKDGFHVRRPGPLASQIIFVLVNDVIPNYWDILSKDQAQRKTLRRLIKSLRSPAGIPAVTSRLKLISRSETSAKGSLAQSSQINTAENVKSGLELLDCLLHGDDIFSHLWKDIMRLEPDRTKRIYIADGLVSLLAGGGVLAAAAQAEIYVRENSPKIHKETWLSSGRDFASWVGRNVLRLSQDVLADGDEARSFRTSMLSKGLRLGHSELLLGAVISHPLHGSSETVSTCRDILHDLPPFMQPDAVDIVLRLLAERFPGLHASKRVSGPAALLQALLDTNKAMLNHLVAWLVDFSGGNIGLPFDLFRAVILLVSLDLDRLKKTFDSALDRFGSKRSIERIPMLQQEFQTKVLLVTTGYIYRKDRAFLEKAKSTSPYLNAISNRLAASSARLQFFGMAFAMAVSGLVDKDDSMLKFDTREIKSDEGQQYLQLVRVEDSVGAMTDLMPSKALTEDRPARKVKLQAKPSFAKAATGKAKIVAIEEVEESESEDDLPVYAKPDSDPEDEDDDPTVVNRNKPTPPVYIRDLLAGLRDDDNYDRHKLAIEHAPALIRRKTNFGTEVSDHIDDLATRLVGLKDSFSLDDFHEKRLQAMIAVIVAKPLEMGQWFANTYFNGDYSMSQRAAILSALTFAARELAGLKEEDADMTGINDVPDFPSKRLPEKYAKMYPLEAAPINRLAGKLEHSIIKPLALEAADRATGPNILKVRTFSSRMEVEKKRKRAIPNELAKIVANGFFYPLTGRWSSVVRARGDSSVFTTPFLLSQFLRTLALILSASGSSTLSLQGMTTELWGLLLSVRRHALTDKSVLEALLFANLTLLEVNSNDQRRLAEDHAQELMETQAWVQPVFENLRGGPKEEERIKMLASALLIKVKEVIERYQQRLLGPFSQR